MSSLTEKCPFRPMDSGFGMAYCDDTCMAYYKWAGTHQCRRLEAEKLLVRLDALIQEIRDWRRP